MLVFAFTVLLMISSPGPGVLSTAGIGSAFGWSAGSKYIGGLLVGNFAVSMIVISGLWATLETVPFLRTALLVLSVGYLLYLAARIAFAGSKIGFMEARSVPNHWSGIALQFINPKAYAVNVTLFSGFPFWPQSYIVEVLIKLIIFNLIWIPLHFAWLYAGVAVRHMVLSAYIQRRINYFMALALVFVVLLALRSLL